MTGRSSFADQVKFMERNRSAKVRRWEQCITEITRIRTEYILGMPSLPDIVLPARFDQALPANWTPAYPDGQNN